jgi:hypothetical protein
VTQRAPRRRVPRPCAAQVGRAGVAAGRRRAKGEGGVLRERARWQNVPFVSWRFARRRRSPNFLPTRRLPPAAVRRRWASQRAETEAAPACAAGARPLHAPRWRFRSARRRRQRCARARGCRVRCSCAPRRATARGAGAACRACVRTPCAARARRARGARVLAPRTLKTCFAVLLTQTCPAAPLAPPPSLARERRAASASARPPRRVRAPPARAPPPPAVHATLRGFAPQRPVSFTADARAAAPARPLGVIPPQPRRR